MGVVRGDVTARCADTARGAAVARAPLPAARAGAEAGAETGASAGADRARALVLQHGWNATVYRTLDADLEHWLSPGGDALVGFTRQARTRVVAGAPVAAQERLADVAAEFEEHAARQRERVCYVCAEERLLHASPGRYAVVRIGAQPVWDARRWGAVFDAEPGLRAQRNRAINKGVVVEEWETAQVVAHPGIAACRADWQASRRLPPLAFLAYTDLAKAPLVAVKDRRLYVATVGDHMERLAAGRQGGERSGRLVVGYLVAAPIPGRAGWLVEQVVRSPRAANGTVELLIDEAVRSLARGGARLVTLGLAPLSGLSSGDERGWPEGRTLHRSAAVHGLLGAVRAGGGPFYDFAGLESFKRKFRPERWEDVYLLSREPRTSVRTLYAVGAAFCGGRPARTFVGGLLRAMA